MSLYHSPAAKAAVLTLYDQKLAAWPLPYETLDLPTSQGPTRVIVTGNRQNPPLVLVHGANGCAPVALDVYPHLAERFCVYAVDVLGQPNYSAEIPLPYKGAAYGQWLKEVLALLELQEVVLVGFSLGGLVIWKTLLEEETRVKAAFLAQPAGIVAGNPIKGIFKLFLPMKRYIKTQQQKHLHNFVGAMFSEEDPFALAFMGAVVPNYKLDFSPIPNINARAAQRIQTPLYFIGSAHDLLFPGQKLLRRAKKIFPSLQDTLLLANAKHVPSATDHHKIEQWIFDKMGV